MINNIVRYCLHKRYAVILVTLLVAVFGYYSWTRMALEAYPELSDVMAQVTTQAPGLAAEEVEQQITIPLERQLSGTPGLVHMRSSSTFGLSLITLSFKDGAEDYWERQRVTERMAQATLPAGITPSLDAVSGAAGEIYRYTLESNTRNLRELSELQFWTVIPRLKKVSGVIDIANFGGLTTQFMLEIDPSKLVQYGITLQQIKDALNANNSSAGGSLMNRGEQAYVIRGVGLIRSLDDMGNVVVNAKNGTPVLVKDLGTISYGNVDRRGILGKDNNPDAIEGIVLLLKDANASEVIGGVHAAVDDLNNNLLPKDVRLVPYLDRSSLIDATTHTVGKTLAEGMLLVTLVLLLALGSLRAALIVALTIPLSMLIAFTFMHHLHIPANLLSLGAIDFGILVDGAVVLVENILRRREQQADQPITATDAISATLQVVRPIFFGMLVIIAAYIPLFAFERIEYKLFSPMAFAVGSALIGALIVALCLIPGLAYLAFRTPRKIFHNRPLERLVAAYQRFLAAALGKTRWIVATCTLTLLGIGLLGASIGRDFLPYLDEGSLWLQVTMPPGITLDKAAAMANTLRHATLEFPEVSYIVTQTGRNDDGTDPWTVSHIEASVGLHPYSNWKSGLSKQELIARLAERYKKLSGFSVGFMQPMIDGVQDKLSGAHSDLVVKIYGENFDEMRRIAGEVSGILNKVPGAADVAIDQEPPLPNLRIDVDRAAAARYGINIADISDLISTGIGGAAIGQVYVGERNYDMTIRFPLSTRNDPDAIAALLLTAPGGAKIPLGQVARITTVSGESTITREAARRHLTVKLNVRKRDLSSFLGEAQAAISNGVKYDHQRYQIAWGGQFENLERAEARLMVILPTTLAIMFLLLFAEFGNLRQPALILLVVPLSVIGGLAALHLRGMTLNMSSAVGFIALFGVAVLNGVLMISHINRLRKEDGKSLRTAVMEGACIRIRPVLVTATVAICGLTPAMLASGLGSDVQRPLATVVVGGLLSATVLTLVLLPSLYFLIEDRLAARAQRRAGQDLPPQDIASGGQA